MLTPCAARGRATTLLIACAAPSPSHPPAACPRALRAALLGKLEKAEGYVKDLEAQEAELNSAIAKLE